jgi:hypothetical protein
MRFLKLILPVCVIIFFGCDDDVVCTTEYVYAVEATLMDFETNRPLEAVKPIGRIYEANYSDSMIISHKSENMNEYILLLGAGERPGNYSVSIDVDGYQTWKQDNIIVTKNECHVNQRKITAFLKKK